MKIRPRLYLDIDGVLCPIDGGPEDAWGAVEGASIRIDYGGGMRATYNVIWATELLIALDGLRAEFDLELVWLSTWNELDHVRKLLVPRFGALEGGRIIDLPIGPSNHPNTRGGWKADELLFDQQADPAPFIWIDDAEVAAHRDSVRRSTIDTFSLMVEPDPRVGLTFSDVAQMRAWLSQPEGVNGVLER